MYMKNITLFAFMMLCMGSYAQTYAVYTEDTTVGSGLEHIRFSNGQGFTLSEPATAPYEGTENYMLTFNGTSSYFHAIFIPRNSTDTSDIAIDISGYNYYNVAFKTTGATPFYIRMRGNGITAKVAIDPTSNGYGFANDGQWHFMSIPFTDFIPESTSFSLTNITEIFVLRSNTSGSTAGLDNNFEFDDIYVSTTQIMANHHEEDIQVAIYPNPTTDFLYIKTQETIDTIEVFDILGKKVMNITPTDHITHANIASLEKGIYMVSVVANGKVSTSKIMKN